MGKAVLTHKSGSIYDDLPEERYHFPATYLGAVESTVGDFVIYYEPGRTQTGTRNRRGLQAYVAAAQVIDISPDAKRNDHFYALIAPGSYVIFDRPVPFREGSQYYEHALRKDDGSTNRGAFGRAVRPLSAAEFDNILRAGFARELGLQAEVDVSRGLAEPAETYDRPVVQWLLERPLRDAAFARAVQRAYEATCAVTGLRIINGGGRAEVQAAHIRPVKHQGPDSVRNGLALSGTAHWMFDRGLISIGDPPDYPLLLPREGLPENVKRLLNADGRLRRPHEQRFWPAPSYLEFHRKQIFGT